MSKETFTPFDAAEYLDNEQDVPLYLQISLEEDGIKGFQRALGTLARAKGMTALANETGLGRQNLYKALSDEGSPKFETVNKIVQALGCKLMVTHENQPTL